MLIPRVDLTALFPQRAAAYIEERGGTVHCGVSIQSLRREGLFWRLESRGVRPEAEVYDGVVVATPPGQASQLAGALTAVPELAAIRFEPITTCYLQYAPTVRLPNPFLALIDRPARCEWGQFVFDRGWLNPKHAGLLAVVVSASAEATGHGHDALTKAITRQLADALRMPELSAASWSRVVTEKRATFSCTPGLLRPTNATTVESLVLAGDYTASDYPATLESAARSGVLAARAL